MAFNVTLTLSLTLMLAQTLTLTRTLTLTQGSRTLHQWCQCPRIRPPLIHTLRHQPLKTEYVPNAFEQGAGVGILGIVAMALGAQNVAITEINDLCR